MAKVCFSNSIIKDSDAHIRFAFLMGVSKFSKVSLFSRLNNLHDTQYEGYWASVFYSYFAALGLDLVLEDAANHGRIDMVLCLNGCTWLFEFNVVELVPEGRVLKQLQGRGYADKYRADGPVYLIGVEFSRDSRNIVGFETWTV